MCSCVSSVDVKQELGESRLEVFLLVFEPVYWLEIHMHLRVLMAFIASKHLGWDPFIAPGTSEALSGRCTGTI